MCIISKAAAISLLILALPATSNAGFITGAIVGGAAGKMACTAYQKELACIKAALKDPAWKGHEDKIVDTCEASLKPKPAEPVKPPVQ